MNQGCAQHLPFTRPHTQACMPGLQEHHRHTLVSVRTRRRNGTRSCLLSAQMLYNDLLQQMRRDAPQHLLDNREVYHAERVVALQSHTGYVLFPFSSSLQPKILASVLRTEIEPSAKTLPALCERHERLCCKVAGLDTDMDRRRR